MAENKGRTDGAADQDKMADNGQAQDSGQSASHNQVANETNSSAKNNDNGQNDAGGINGHDDADSSAKNGQDQQNDVTAGKNGDQHSSSSSDADSSKTDGSPTNTGDDESSSSEKNSEQSNDPVIKKMQSLTGQNFGKGNFLKDEAKKLGKKGAKKAAKVALPVGAGYYVGGKLFEKFNRMLGMALQSMLNAIYTFLSTSGVASVINAIHSAIMAVKNFFSWVGNMMGQAGHAIASFFGGIGNFFGGVFNGISSAVGNALGLNAVTAQAATIGSVVMLTVGIAGGFGYNEFAQNGVRDGIPEDNCATEQANYQDSGGKIDSTKQQLKDQKIVYEALRMYGLNRAQATGVMGNWMRESNIDPTSIEGIFGEPYHIGPKKKAAMKDLHGYVDTLPSGHNPGYGTGEDRYPGMGMGQWTGPNARKLLETAKKVKKDWFDIDFQTAYLIGTPSPTTGETPDKFWPVYKKNGGNSPKDCALYFFAKWEGIDDGTGSERAKYAEEFYNASKDWSTSGKDGATVLALAKKLGAKATADAVAESIEKCNQDVAALGDNDDIANAALSFAHDSQEAAHFNDGTELYKRVHDNTGVSPRSHYQSCDAVVASAVRWSGTDTNYPPLLVSAQLAYVSHSSRWKKVGTTDTVPYSKLKPGDIFLKDGEHTYIYVGEKLVQESVKKLHRHGTPKNGDDVDGSSGERSAGIGPEAHYTYAGNDGTYDIYRCVSPMHSKKYAHAGEK